MAQLVKNPPAMQETQETWVGSLDWKDPLEKKMATHSSILARETPWTEEPAGYSPKGLKESDSTEAAEHAHTQGIFYVIHLISDRVETSIPVPSPFVSFLFLIFIAISQLTRVELAPKQDAY